MSAFLICLLVAVGTSILMVLSDKLERAGLRKVVLRKQITPQQARRRVKADGFRINGHIYVRPDLLRGFRESRPIQIHTAHCFVSSRQVSARRCNPEDPT